MFVQETSLFLIMVYLSQKRNKQQNLWKFIYLFILLR